ncbi:MAG TPA: hypothetical protein VLZ28_05570 [Daejeonella sp.]|nr:hypothetical protein [Daejeonella sp.]
MSVNSFLSRVTFLFCLFLLSGSALFADQKPKNYDAIIHTNTDHRYKGLLLDVSDKGMTIDYLGQQKFFGADSISSIKIKRTGSRKRHSLTAGGIGLLAGIPIYVDGNSKGKLSSLALPVVVVGTAVGGVLIGSLVNSVTAVQRFNKINQETSFKSIQPVLLRYSQASPTRVPTE